MWLFVHKDDFEKLDDFPFIIINDNCYYLCPIVNKFLFAYHSLSCYGRDSDLCKNRGLWFVYSKEDTVVLSVSFIISSFSCDILC